MIKVSKCIYSTCVSKPSVPTANLISSKSVVMQLNIASVPILKKTLSFSPTQTKTLEYQFKEKPYLDFSLGLDGDGGIENRIFSIHLQTKAGVKPVPVRSQLSQI